MQNLLDGPFGPGRRRRPVRRPRARRRPPHRRDPAAQRRRHRAARQPVLPAPGAAMGGEVGANLQKIFAYGLRNGFGMAFDPQSGDLWEQENGDDSFSELNRVRAGHELRLGPDHGPGVARRPVQGDRDRPDGAAAVRADGFFGLQQIRWPPTNIADTPAEALVAAVHAAGRALQRPGVQLEVRGGARRHRLPGQPARSGASTTATCSWRGARDLPRAATCSAST